MSSAINNNQILMYADDTTLHCVDANINNLCNKLSNNLKIINKWLKCNYLTLNLSKTKYTIFLYKTFQIVFRFH